MGPKTWKIISQLKDYCDLQHGRRSKVASELGLQRQVLTHWFAKRKQPTSEQILMVLELLSSQENENRKRSGAVITIFDGNRIERYTTLSDAVPAARNWYSKLAGKKLPELPYCCFALVTRDSCVFQVKDQLF